ncbi:hypothetical protein FACS1894190_06790 [Spirochaetia bacterium]|nr:hypothetical protein FACS1894190_06790 [Spirochaetia bacterium]
MNKKTLTEKAMLLIPASQLEVTLSSKELMSAMADKLNALAESVPKLYETDGKKDAKIALHYFFGSTDFYAMEFDGEDEFFGYMILNGDFQMSEYGYQRRSELFNALPLINLDYYFDPITIAEMKKNYQQ